MPKIAFPRFRTEVHELYKPPLRARNTELKILQVLALLEALGVKTTADLTPPLVSRFIRHNPKWSPATVKGLLSYLAPICRYAVLMGYTRVNPFEVRKVGDWLRACEPRERKARPTHLSLDEVASILRVAGTHAEEWKGARTEAMIATVAYTGMRRMELLTRKREDFLLAERLCRVFPREGRRLKTASSSRVVPIPDALAEVLERWFGRIDSEWAFPGVRGSVPWTSGMLGSRPLDALKAIGREAGVPHVTFHVFRHTLATHAERLGLGMVEVQQILGHTTIRTTLGHYHHRDVPSLIRAARGLRFAG